MRRTRKTSGPGPRIAVVVLTRYDRPVELARALTSVQSQDISSQLVLVANGAYEPGFEQPDKLVMLHKNVGIPAGRNVGAEVADAPLIMFLDDDAELLDPQTLAEIVRRFDAHPGMGAMALHLIDEHGNTQRRHVPRLGDRTADKSGNVTYFVGAACVVRASAFNSVGRFDARFFYAMEESDLAWRLLDAGWSIWYAADLTAYHPRTTPTRHPGYARLTARNRLWMAWRSLPAPLLVAYLGVWTAAAIVRGAPVRDVVTGYRAGWRARPQRHPIKWSTVATMSLLGRPPIL
ncbi:glycosyltransferase [Microlunatus ginsengisoli]|uniref:Glycosyltransferase n=2 Tax=Microlunatus ginsengisoli TaxID=363863 RepID=A0ABP7AK96_9ACTN